MGNVIKMMCLLELEEQLLKITQGLLNVILEMDNAMDKLELFRRMGIHFILILKMEN
jgi:hypothetical protein